jgi:hypothetical protein
MSGDKNISLLIETITAKERYFLKAQLYLEFLR